MQGRRWNVGAFPWKSWSRSWKNPNRWLMTPREIGFINPKLIFKEGKIYLVRVVTVEEAGVSIVVTVYRTSKVEKYWRKA